MAFTPQKVKINAYNIWPEVKNIIHEGWGFFVFVFLKSCYIVLSERMLDYVWAINLGFGMFF